MSRRSSQDLGDSWVVNDTDDGNISWADDSSADEHVKVRTRTPQSSPRSARLSSSTTSNSATRAPEFIMPSIDENSRQPRQRVTPHKQNLKSVIRDTKPKPSSARTTPTRKPSPKYPDFKDYLSAAALKCMFWALDIIGNTFVWLKSPLSFMLGLWLIIGCAMFGWNLATASVTYALTPICRIPGVRFLNLPLCQSPYGNHHPRISAGPVPEPEFDALMNVQSQFESIMSDTASTVSLPMDMKKSESGIRDLRLLVSFSQIPSRNELMNEFNNFIETARIASYDLQKFNSHVGKGVDIVLSNARWTKRMLDDINHQNSQRGLLPAFFTDVLLSPFQPVTFTEQRLLHQYITHSQVISGEIQTLIEEAQALLKVLTNLEDRLEIIYKIAYHDDMQVKGTKEEVLAQIWSHFGGNRAKKSQLERQLRLLSRVMEYRKSAVDYILATIIKLQSMGAELEELRARVDSAEVLHNAGVKNIPLSVHIENIQLGVERLESGRERARELENKHTRQILDKMDNLEAARDIKYLSPN